MWQKKLFSLNRTRRNCLKHQRSSKSLQNRPNHRGFLEKSLKMSKKSKKLERPQHIVTSQRRILTRKTTKVSKKTSKMSRLMSNFWICKPSIHIKIKRKTKLSEKTPNNLRKSVLKRLKIFLCKNNQVYTIGLQLSIQKQKLRWHPMTISNTPRICWRWILGKKQKLNQPKKTISTLMRTSQKWRCQSSCSGTRKKSHIWPPKN